MATKVVERLFGKFGVSPDVLNCSLEYLRGEIFDLCRTIRADQAVKTARLHRCVEEDFVIEGRISSDGLEHEYRVVRRDD